MYRRFFWAYLILLIYKFKAFSPVLQVEVMAPRIEVKVQQMSSQSEPHSFLDTAICSKVRK